jgi:hypothetical protein
MEAIIAGWRVVFAKAAAASSSAARSDHNALEAENAFKKRSTTFVSEERTLYQSQEKNLGTIGLTRPLHTQKLQGRDREDNTTSWCRSERTRGEHAVSSRGTEVGPAAVAEARAAATAAGLSCGPK